MQSPLVTLTDVGKIYPNGAGALAGFSCTLHEGEFLSLLGPSGCGKSTVLRIIAGLSQPTRGTVERMWQTPGDRRAEAPIGCVFQEPTLLPWATVWKNVYLPLRLRGVRKATAKTQVDEALAMVGLSGFANAYPRQLSGGMKMRTSVARALVTSPRLLLLDEPFAALDEITRNRLNDDLLELWRRQRWTVLFITHSVMESAYLSTRILVMSPRPGRVVAEIPSTLPAGRPPAIRTSSEYLELTRRLSAELEHSLATAVG